MVSTSAHTMASASEREQPSITKIENILNDVAQEDMNKPRLIGIHGEEVELPESVVHLLRAAVTYLAQGQVVNIVPMEKEMTTQEAADLLNVSRPYLVSLLEKGELAFRKVGTHRRIRFDDLMAYKQKRDIQTRQALKEITRLGEELELYDN